MGRNIFAPPFYGQDEVELLSHGLVSTAQWKTKEIGRYQEGTESPSAAVAFAFR